MIFNKEKLIEAQSKAKLSECSDARISKMLKFICINLGVPKSKIYGMDGDFDEMEIFYNQIKKLPYTPEYIEMAFSYAVLDKFKSELRLFDKNISVTFISDVVKAFYAWYGPMIQKKDKVRQIDSMTPEKIKEVGHKTLIDFYNFKKANPKDKTFFSPTGLKIYQVIYHYLNDFKLLNVSESKFEQRFGELMDFERMIEKKRLESGEILRTSRDLHEAKRESAKVKSFTSHIPGGEDTYKTRVENKTCKFFVDEFTLELIESEIHIKDLL